MKSPDTFAEVDLGRDVVVFHHGDIVVLDVSTVWSESDQVRIGAQLEPA